MAVNRVRGVVAAKVSWSPEFGQEVKLGFS